MPRSKKKTKEAKTSKEKMVSIYDPGVDAFREVPFSIAKKFVESSKEVEKTLAKMEEENE